MGRFFGVEGPVTLPRLTWGTVPFVLIEIIGPARVLRVRGCGKTFGVFQTPAQVGLRVAADVKDSAGVSAQRLVVAPRGLVGPWVPGGAVASNSAAAGFWGDISYRRAEATSQDLNSRAESLGGRSVPGFGQYFWPCKFHGHSVPVHSAGGDIFFKGICHRIRFSDLVCWREITRLYYILY